jgi:hypothetical protein
VGEEKPSVGSATRKVARPAMIRDRRPEMVVRSRGFLPREGTSGRESFERVTVLGVEATLAAFAETRRGKTARKIERGRRQGY